MLEEENGLPIQADLRSCGRFTSLAKVKPPNDSIRFFSIV